MTSESELLAAIRLKCGVGPVRLLRNNCGRLMDANGRWVSFGLAPGSGDLIGWRTVTVTPDMVGQTVAIFSSLEVKSARGRSTDAQAAWARAVRAAGGIAGEVRSVNEAKLILALGPAQARTSA